MNKTKLQSFDTFKYLLALCVLLGHSFIVLYPGAIIQHIEAYAVDGFFLISGFFLAKSCLRLSKKESNPYSALKTSVVNRYKRLAPEMLFGAIFSALIGFIIMSKQIDWSMLAFNISFLGEVNKMPSLFVGMWYISVLFWVSAILSAVCFFSNKVKNNEQGLNTVKYIILPLIILCCILFIAPNADNLVMHGNTFKIFKTWSDGWFKGLLEISLGMETYFIASYLKDKNIQIKLAFLWEILGLCLVLIPMTASALNVTDFILLPGYMILIVLLYLKQESLLKFMSWEPLAKITSCSYMLFIINVALLKSIKFCGGYANYSIWLVCGAIVIGFTIIALAAHKLCGLILPRLGMFYSWLDNYKKKDIIKSITYFCIVIGLIISTVVYYNGHMLNANLSYVKKSSISLGLNDGKQISKDFKILFRTKLNHIRCRFFTWKNEYKKNSSIYFTVLSTTDGKSVPVISESIKLNDIKDNDILDLNVGTILTPGEYKFIIQADKNEKSFAISTIKTTKQGNYYINDNKVNQKNDIQCALTY